MNKIIILTLMLVLIVLVGCQKETKTETLEDFTNLRLKSIELLEISNGKKVTGEYNNARYDLFIQDGKILREVNTGALNKDYWTEVRIEESGVYMLFCSGLGFYSSSKNTKFINISEIDTQELVCKQWKAGNLNITTKGNLRDDNEIEIEISSKGKINPLTICEQHGIGITSVSMNRQTNKCEGYSWLNYSLHIYPNETSKEDYYEWLPENQYFCSSKDEIEEIAICDLVDYTLCYSQLEEVIPNRYKDRVHKCFYGGGSFFNDTRTYKFQIDKSSFVDNKDYIEIFIIDTDRRAEDFQTGKVYFSDNEGQDIGGEDEEIRFEY